MKTRFMKQLTAAGLIAAMALTQSVFTFADEAADKITLYIHLVLRVELCCRYLLVIEERRNVVYRIASSYKGRSSSGPEFVRAVSCTPAGIECY